ncbi:MAG: M24 family metallopeptidase [Thermodesulfobacteriota bacterium]
MKESLDYEMRRNFLREIIRANHLNGVLLTSLENISYLCGFTGSDGAFVLTPDRSYFLCDSRYWTQADQEVKACQIVHYEKKLDGIVSLLVDLNIKKIGFESTSLTFSLYQSLLGKLTNQAELHPLEAELRNLRAAKDEVEMVLIRKAIDLASQAFLHMIERLEEGAVEKDVALEMEFFMKRTGVQNLGFDIIIASGKRSALPHGRASEKRIEKGDFILIDFGSGFRGYHSDQTRTLICGKPSSKQEEIYQIVKGAHDRAIEKVRPGIPISEVDSAARSYIRDQGYADYFGHGTGHGIGLAVHEDPAVNSENKDLLKEGMVFTIEPGIYIPDWGGVRIEDMVRVTPQGAEVLTYLPTELKVI